MAVPTARASALQPALHFETEEEATELVEGAVEQVRGVAVTVRGEVVSGAGSTARELLEIARSFEATLIIVGDRSSRVTDLLLGDVAHRIVHLAPARSCWFARSVAAGGVGSYDEISAGVSAEGRSGTRRRLVR
jgi:nucleotide-binding universal stress UspA family protein